MFRFSFILNRKPLWQKVLRDKQENYLVEYSSDPTL